SRRQLLKSMTCGFGSLALAGLCAENAQAGADPLSPREPHHPPRAKRIIFVFMQGGPSQVDTFDYKPRLEKDDGKKVDFFLARSRKIAPQPVMRSPWKFKQYGDSGRWVSELFPHITRHVDDLCF